AHFSLAGRPPEPFFCSWLSWRMIPAALQECTHSAAMALIEMVQRLDLTYFIGFSQVRPVAELPFRFDHNIKHFDWNIGADARSHWSFVT
ncbi:MAG: hypothetical protein KC983_03010, partial [Phycisphaerales bacterium]|nr:hypothetical protein [Phycisphaerales bacterium]